MADNNTLHVYQETTQIQFKEFPTPGLLRQANTDYAALDRPIPVTEDDVVEPYPCPSSKKQIYKPDEAFDLYCSNVRLFKIYISLYFYVS